tara:strand:- start:29 stop:823 length:795 start_codon:yes stop_codon:yes gene_type:complete
MKIAFCFVGQLRSGQHNIVQQNYKKFISELWGNCDFFIHTWNINTPSPGFEINIDAAVIPEEIVPISGIQLFSNYYKPKSLTVDRYSEYCERTSAYTLQPIYYSISQALLLKQQHERQHSFQYDYVVISRPDLAINYDSVTLASIIRAVMDNSIHFADIHNQHLSFFDNCMWIGTNNNLNLTTTFHSHYQDISTIDGVPMSGPDDQQYLRSWLMDSHQILGIPFGFDDIWIYRNYHLLDFQLLPNDVTGVKHVDVNNNIRPRPL